MSSSAAQSNVAGVTRALAFIASLQGQLDRDAEEGRCVASLSCTLLTGQWRVTSAKIAVHRTFW